MVFRQVVDEESVIQYQNQSPLTGDRPSFLQCLDRVVISDVCQPSYETAKKLLSRCTREIYPQYEDGVLHSQYSTFANRLHHSHKAEMTCQLAIPNKCPPGAQHHLQEVVLHCAHRKVCGFLVSARLWARSSRDSFRVWRKGYSRRSVPKAPLRDHLRGKDA